MSARVDWGSSVQDCISKTAKLENFFFFLKGVAIIFWDFCFFGIYTLFLPLPAILGGFWSDNDDDPPPHLTPHVLLLPLLVVLLLVHLLLSLCPKKIPTNIWTYKLIRPKGWFSEMHEYKEYTVGVSWQSLLSWFWIPSVFLSEY